MVIHPLTDHRRTLPLDKKGELLHAHPDFQLVISYNPGYQTLMKDLKQSTKQRFTAFDFDYPEAALETQIVAEETGMDEAVAAKLVKIAGVARNLKGHGLDEGISTRLLVYAATLIKDGVAPRDACRMALVRPITDDADIRDTLDHAIDAHICGLSRIEPQRRGCDAGSPHAHDVALRASSRPSRIKNDRNRIPASPDGGLLEAARLRFSAGGGGVRGCHGRGAVRAYRGGARRLPRGRAGSSASWGAAWSRCWRSWKNGRPPRRRWANPLCPR